MPQRPEPSDVAKSYAVQHELSEQQQRLLAIRQEMYGWQEEVDRLLAHINDLEDELDYLWNRQESLAE